MKVGSSCSNKYNVISGISQGSILGQILFPIYINDLPNCFTSQCKMFADDLTIYDKSFNHYIVQLNMNNKVKWSSNWCLYFNTNECNLLHNGEKNTNCDYFMSIGEVIYKLNSSQLGKGLGVNFDPKLISSRHIHEITHKATKILGILK